MAEFPGQFRSEQRVAVRWIVTAAVVALIVAGPR